MPNSPGVTDVPRCTGFRCCGVVTGAPGADPAPGAEGRPGVAPGLDTPPDAAPLPRDDDVPEDELPPDEEDCASAGLIASSDARAVAANFCM